MSTLSAELAAAPMPRSSSRLIDQMAARWEQQGLLPHLAPDDFYLGISTAAHLSGIPSNTLRKAVSRKKLAAVSVVPVQGQRTVPLILRWGEVVAYRAQATEERSQAQRTRRAREQQALDAYGRVSGQLRLLQTALQQALDQVQGLLAKLPPLEDITAASPKVPPA